MFQKFYLVRSKGILETGNFIHRIENSYGNGFFATLLHIWHIEQKIKFTMSQIYAQVINF